MTRENLRAIIAGAIGDSTRVDPLLLALEAAGVRMVPVEAYVMLTAALQAALVDDEEPMFSFVMMATQDVERVRAMLAASPYATQQDAKE